MDSPTTKELLLSAPDLSAVPEPSNWYEHREGKTWWEGPGIALSTYSSFQPNERTLTINAPNYRGSQDAAEKFLHDILVQAQDAGVDGLILYSGNPQWHEAIWSMSRAGLIHIITVSGPVIYARLG